MSASSSGPLHFEQSVLAHRFTLHVSCIGISHWGHCALALLPICTGFTPPLTSTNTHLQSRHRLAGTLFASIRDSATLVTFKTAFKTHLVNSVYTSHHWLPSISASDSLFHDILQQLKKFMLIDWLIHSFIGWAYTGGRPKNEASTFDISHLQNNLNQFAWFLAQFDAVLFSTHLLTLYSSTL